VLVNGEEHRYVGLGGRRRTDFDAEVGPGSFARCGGTAFRCSTSSRRRRGSRARRRRRWWRRRAPRGRPRTASAKIDSAPAPELAVEQLDDLEHGHLGGLAGERVAALHAALGAQDAAAAQDREELLEELDRDVAAAGELADRDWAVAAGARELGERAQGVRATCS
jgi:hypothetical protein